MNPTQQDIDYFLLSIEELKRKTELEFQSKFGCAIIILSKGKVALVDIEDYKWLSKWSWYAQLRRGKWYACREERKGIKKTKVHLHREVLGLLDFSIDNRIADHLYGDGLDNRKANLRITNHSGNSQNRSSFKNSTSKYLGVCTNRNKWSAQMTINRKKTHLGIFPKTPCGELLAALAYDISIEQNHSKGARLNFPILHAEA